MVHNEIPLIQSGLAQNLGLLHAGTEKVAWMRWLIVHDILPRDA